MMAPQHIHIVHVGLKLQRWIFYFYFEIKDAPIDQLETDGGHDRQPSNQCQIYPILTHDCYMEPSQSFRNTSIHKSGTFSVKMQKLFKCEWAVHGFAAVGHSPLHMDERVCATAGSAG